MARLRGRRWQADVRLPDDVRLRPTFATRVEAEAWEASTRLSVEQGKPVPPARRPAKNAGLAQLGNVFDHVWRTEWSSMKAAKTMKINATTVVEYFGRQKRLEQISSADVAEFKTALAERGLAPTTVNRKVASLSKMLSVAQEAGAIERKPKINWNHEEKTRFRYLDRDEERAMLAYWTAQNDDDMHDLTILLLDTGARCWGEMCPVRWDALGPSFASLTFWQTKAGKPRTVPLTARSREVLLRRQRLKPTALGPFTGVNRSTMTDRWKTMRDVLKMPDVTPHTLRHTCCTRLVNGGVDVKRVMEWMGHSAIVTTMRYMQIKPNALEGVLHVLEGGPSKTDRAAHNP